VLNLGACLNSILGINKNKLEAVILLVPLKGSDSVLFVEEPF